ncbi:hypothetical protein VL10_24160 [Leclercia adecarboxylata]|nr:hypothetical protein VL10_24160 [Leclercia adecarboxylata]KMN66765.1 hypothetical protein VK95_04600 [Leclercia sp. LK8]
MTTPEEYEQFVQQMQRDSARLERQSRAFEELKNTLDELKANASRDPEAARRLEKMNALRQDADFNALYAKAEQDLQTLSAWMGRMNRQTEQAERSGIIPAELAKKESGKSKPGLKKRNFA